jgi:hypothetical protein
MGLWPFNSRLRFLLYPPEIALGVSSQFSVETLVLKYAHGNISLCVQNIQAGILIPMPPDARHVPIQMSSPIMKVLVSKIFAASIYGHL